MGPINYAMQVQSPFEGQLAGIKLGATLADMESALAKQAMERQAAQQAMARQQLVQQGMASLMANPNPTAQDYINLSMLLPEKEAASMRANWETLSKERQSNELKFGGQVYAAFQSGQPQIAIDLLRQRGEAERNSGRASEAQVYETYAALAERSPEMATRSIGVLLAGLPGGDKVLEGVGKVGAEARAEALFKPDLAKKEAEAKQAGVAAEYAPAVAQAGLTKAQSEALTAATAAKYADQVQRLGIQQSEAQIRKIGFDIQNAAAKLNLDRERLGLDAANIASQIAERGGKIPEGAAKLVNEAAIASGAAKQSEDQLNSLANRITSLGTSWGVLGSAAESLAKLTGSQDAKTMLLQEYTRLRNDAAIRSLPPGPATDRDIELAMKGFPPENANPQVLSQFLRGMAKMQGITAKVEASKAEFLSNNKGLLTRASSPFIAGDFAVKPGESFTELAARIAQSVNDQYRGGQPGALQQQIPGYAPAGVPAAGATPPGAASIRSQADAIIRGGR